MRKISLVILVFLVLPSIFVCFFNAQSKAKPDVLFVEQFSTNTANIESEKKANRIPAIDPNQLPQIQKVIWRKIQRENLFSDVRLLAPGEKPLLEEGKTGWILGGQFIDYKKGNEVLRYLVSFGAGKQKLEIMLSIKDIQTGKIIKEERVVDRKWAGWVGGDSEKGMRDFAERIVVLLKNMF